MVTFQLKVKHRADNIIHVSLFV